MSETTPTIDTATMVVFLRKLASDLKSSKIEAVADRLEYHVAKIDTLETTIKSIATLCTEN